MVEGLGGHVPTAAIVRVGERPDDLSYERNVMKKIASFGMEARSFAFPESIREGEFQAEFQKINGDPSIDGILLFCPLPRHMNAVSYTHLAPSPAPATVDRMIRKPGEIKENTGIYFNIQLAATAITTIRNT